MLLRSPLVVAKLPAKDDAGDGSDNSFLGLVGQVAELSSAQRLGVVPG